jgi:hypothetical protein
VYLPCFLFWWLSSYDFSIYSFLIFLLSLPRKDVDFINQKNLRELKGKLHEFHAVDSGEEETYRKSLESQCPVKSKLFLKIGCQVNPLSILC